MSVISPSVLHEVIATDRQPTIAITDSNRMKVVFPVPLMCLVLLVVFVVHFRISKVNDNAPRLIFMFVHIFYKVFFVLADLF